MKNPIPPIMSFIDGNLVIRRLVLFFTLYMTYIGTSSAWAYAKASPFDGLGTAAVIAAVLAPIAALQGFAFSTYLKGRSE